MLILIIILVITGIVLNRGFRVAKNKKRFLIIICIVFGVISLPVSVPWGRVGFNTIRCGHAPVVGRNFAAAYGYRLPSSHSYAGDVNLFTSKFFCSQQEAERAGYHDSTLELTP